MDLAETGGLCGIAASEMCASATSARGDALPVSISLRGAGTDRYAVTVSPTSHPWLTDHTIQGTPVVPVVLVVPVVPELLVCRTLATEYAGKPVLQLDLDDL